MGLKNEMESCVKKFVTYESPPQNLVTGFTMATIIKIIHIKIDSFIMSHSTCI